MKTALWIVLFLFGLTGVLLPAMYLYTANGLPQLDTEYDLDTHLRLTVENERMSVALGLPQSERGFVKWEKPDLSRYPKDFVALYLSQMGCPDYFKSPRESGLAWSWRMLKSTWGEGFSGDPGGACEFQFIQRLTEALSIKGKLDTAVAAHKIHVYMQKDQLIAYDLSTTWIERGVMGIDQAVPKALQKDLKDMSLSELAEAALIAAPFYLYEDIKTCGNAALIKRARDEVLAQIAVDELVSEQQATAAQADGVACLRTK